MERGGGDSWFTLTHYLDSVHADQPRLPEVEIVEATIERLDDIEALWCAMHVYNVEVAERAREVVPLRPAADS